MIKFNDGDILCSEIGYQLIYNKGYLSVNDPPLSKEELSKRNMITIINEKDHRHDYWYQIN